MNSQQLLYINLILGVVFLLYFFFGRGQPKAPTRLNLKNKETPLEKPLNPDRLDSQKIQQPQITSKMTILEPETEQTQAKNLAIFFMYNGHGWEAYGVLGLAQGANMKSVTESYQKLLELNDPKSYDFLEAAYKAILEKKRRDVLWASAQDKTYTNSHASVNFLRSLYNNHSAATSSKKVSPLHV